MILEKRCLNCGLIQNRTETVCKRCGKDVFYDLPPREESEAATTLTPGARIDENTLTVALLGFSTAGKTWFLERTKTIFQDENGGGQRARHISPRPKEHGALVDGTLERGVHTIGWAGQPLEYRIIDLPGERLSAIFSEEGRVGASAGARDLLEALVDANAVIVMLPAEDLFFAETIAGPRYRHLRDSASAMEPEGSGQMSGEEVAELETLVATLQERAPADPRLTQAWEAEVAAAVAEHGAQQDWNWARRAAQVRQLVDDIAIVASLLRLTELGLLPSDLLGRRKSELEAYISRGFEPPDKPLYIAISKSDMLLEPTVSLAELLRSRCGTPDLSRIDLDPLHSLRERAPALWSARGLFRWVKADFVTSFYGHDGGLRLNYDTTHPLGVDAVIKWMKSVRRQYGERRARALAKARMLRDLRDGAFAVDQTGVI